MQRIAYQKSAERIASTILKSQLREWLGQTHLLSSEGVIFLVKSLLLSTQPHKVCALCALKVISVYVCV